MVARPAVRALTEADIPAAMALVDQAGWNQTPADWRRFLSASPDGCFAAIVDDRLIGTSATIAYGDRVAWIGMVIVDRERRGQGIGARLLDEASAAIQRRNIPCAKLDATPAGEPLYRKHGFARELLLERWELVRAEPPDDRDDAGETTPMSDDSIDVDSSLFGADRRALVRSLRDESPDFAMEVQDARGLRGFALGRRGFRADHIGPWMARDEGAAQLLLDTFLARSSRPRVFVDFVVKHPFARRLIEARGFRLSRPLVRMSRGAEPAANDRDLLAVVGPEFG